MNILILTNNHASANQFLIENEIINMLTINKRIDVFGNIYDLKSLDINEIRGRSPDQIILIINNGTKIGGIMSELTHCVSKSYVPDDFKIQLVEV